MQEREILNRCIHKIKNEKSYIRLFDIYPEKWINRYPNTQIPFIFKLQIS